MNPLTDTERIKKAEQASMLAFLAVMLMLMMNCGGCCTVFVALPVALYALSLSRAALTGDPPDVAKAYAAPARNLSAVVALFSSAFILFIIAYLSLYIFAIGAIVGTAAIAPPPQQHSIPYTP